MKNLLSLNLHNSVFHCETIKGCKLCVNCSGTILNTLAKLSFKWFCLIRIYFVLYCYKIVIVCSLSSSISTNDIHGDEFLNKMYILVILAFPIIAAHVVNYCYLLS